MASHRFDEFSFRLWNLTTGADYRLDPTHILNFEGRTVPGVDLDRLKSASFEIPNGTREADIVNFDGLQLLQVGRFGNPAYTLWGIISKVSDGYGQRGLHDNIKVLVVELEELLKSRDVYHNNGGAIEGISVINAKPDDVAKHLVRMTMLPGTCSPDVDGNSRDWNWGTFTVEADAAQCVDNITDTFFEGTVYDLIEDLAHAYDFDYQLRVTVVAGIPTFEFVTKAPYGGSDLTTLPNRVVIRDLGNLIPTARRWRDMFGRVNAMHVPGFGQVDIDAASILTWGRWEGVISGREDADLEMALAKSDAKSGYSDEFEADGLNRAVQWLEDFHAGDMVLHGNLRLDIPVAADKIKAIIFDFPNKVLRLRIEWGDREPRATDQMKGGKRKPPLDGVPLRPHWGMPVPIDEANAIGAGLGYANEDHVHRGVVQVAGVDVAQLGTGETVNLIAGTNISITADPMNPPNVTFAATGAAAASFAVPSIGFAAAAVEGVSPNVIRADATLKLIFAGDAGTAVPTGGGANTLTINTTAGHGSFAAAGNAVTFTNIWERASGGGLTWVKPVTVGDEIRQYDGTGITFRILSNGDVYGNAQALGTPFHTFDITDYDGWAHDWNVAGDLNSWFNYVGATASKIKWTGGPDGAGNYDTIYGRDIRVLDGEDPAVANIRARLDQTTGLTLNSGLDINVYSDVGMTLKASIDGATGNTYSAGYVNAVVGYRYNNTAAAGNFLRGDGTNFISNTIQASDIATVQLWTSGGGNLYPTSAPTEVQIRSGTDFAVYSDAGTTLKASIDGATGQGYFAGNVGIGQAPTAAYELTVKGDVYLPAKWKTGTGWAKFIVMESYATDSAYTTMIEAKYNYANRFNLKYGGTVFLGVYTTNVYLKTNTGVGTTTPRKALDVLATAAAQLRLTHTDDSVYTDFRTLDTGVLTIAPTGGIVQLQSGVDLEIYSDAGVTKKFDVDGATGNAGAQGYIYSGSYINATAGFRVAGAATAGQYLRGNGTNIVLSAIRAGDLPAHTHAIGFTATATGNQSTSHNHIISYTSTATGNQSTSHNHIISYTSTATGDDYTVTTRDKGRSEVRADWGAGLAPTWVYASASSDGSSPAWKQVYVQQRGHTHPYDKANTPTGNQSASHTHQYDKSNTPTGNQSASHTHQYDKSNTPTI